MTQELVELGRHLFYDKRLSGNGTQSCATCHVQALAFTDRRALGHGSTGELHPRSPMSLVNVAYRDALTWANRNLRTLEEQALAPMFGEHPVELGMAGNEERIYAALGADTRYRELFAAAFASETAVTRERVIAALSAFERSIVSYNSPYDRFRFYNDESALDESARRGMDLFFSDDKANCRSCHLGHVTGNVLGLNLDGASRTSTSDPDEPHLYLFRNTGLYALGDPFSYPLDNLGLYEQTGYEKDIGRFRTPTLRNIALTAPYMHDGSIATLEEVLDHYVAGGRAPNPQLSEFIKPLQLTEQDRADLIAFLHSLTDPVVLTDPRWSDPWLPANIAQALTHPERPQEDRARDGASRPEDVLALMGIAPGQSVLDFHAAGGYFTELLSRAVGPEGHVVATYHEPDRVLSPGVREARYGGERLPNVEVVLAKHNALDRPSQSLDAVLMSMVYHDTYWSGEGVDWGPVDQQALLAELYDALKPGGVFLVIDHQAEAGTDPYESAVATHRIDREVVLRDFTQAGFRLKAESDLLRHPDDQRDVQIFEDSVYRGTDRFMLLFERPH